MRTRLLLPILLVTALLGGALFAACSDDEGRAEAARGDAKQSARNPLAVVIVFDEFPLDIMLGSNGRIDSGRFPNLAKLAATSTWWPNAYTTYDSTTRAIPQVMDGLLAKKESTPDFAGHPRSIFDVFGRRGYRIARNTLIEEATSLCRPRWCPGARKGRPAILPLLQRGRRERFDAFLDGIKASARPTLHFKHMLLPHGPYMFLPSGKQTRRNFSDPLPGMNGPIGFNDAFLTQHNQQRLLLQIGYVDHVLGELVERMQREGTFDKALIAFTADHGIAHSQTPTDNRRVTTRRNIAENAPVPFLIKAPGQRRGRINRGYARTVDFLPTIADVLNFRVGYRTHGRSALRKRPRTVRLIKRNFSGVIKVSARRMQSLRRAHRRRYLRRFGEGGWARIYTGIGPNRGLLGKQAASLSPQPPARVRARFAAAADLRAVDPGTQILPTQIAGPITGGGRRARRSLALAVNGRIEAVGRSFYLKGSRQESFALNVPEAAIKPGRNAVALYEVLAGGSLRLLASV